MAMSHRDFPPLGDDQADDLPRTFRREKEARAREARERAAQERAAAPSLSTMPEATFAPVGGGHAPQVAPAADMQPVIADMPFPAVVRRIDVPFLHLVGFFLKAVLAAIPALLLLGVVLFVMGTVLQAFFPELVKMKILIGVP